MSSNRSRSSMDDSMASRPILSAVVAAETMRNANLPYGAMPPAPPKSEERISLFWRVFGGTILSILALVGVTVYQSFAAGLNDLRNSITHLNETHANMVTKEDLGAKSTALWAASKDVTAQTADLKTRTALLESQLRSADEDRRELNREILSLREQMQALQLRQTDAAPKAKADPMRKSDAD
jgi:septal ring factor EnvC (AmiA/AmiB activator)